MLNDELAKIQWSTALPPIMENPTQNLSSTSRNPPKHHRRKMYSKTLESKSLSSDMEIIAEAIVSAMLGQLVDKLSSPDLLMFARKEKVSNEFNKLRNLLPKIQSLLQDAGEKQKSDTSLQLWLDHLTDLAYDLEDVLDEFATRNLQHKLMDTPSRFKYKVLYFFYLFRNAFNVRMSSEFKEISGRLEDMLKQKEILQLREIAFQERKMFSYQRLPSSSLVEPNVLGRENDKKAITELLFNDENGDDVGVIPICGMGGIGKTTLAQLVYNDDRVTSGFDLKVWVYVSEDFDVVRITKSILRAICCETNGVSDLNKLQVMLEKRLRGTKFLLVLDDVWNENYENWCVLRKPFMGTDLQSKIIVTTRNDEVGSIMGSNTTYHLKLLSNEDCFSLFGRHAFGNRSVPLDLRVIGEEIVKKCKGLPLAVKTMGGLLRNKLDPGDWQAVLNSKIWNLPEERSNIIPALRLSYYYLPSHLKPLFAYCSIFPKDYEFDKDELILLWMAEGFLPQQQEKEQLEDVGHGCFNELLSRSFFERSSGRHFVMHDLIHALAQYVARDICFCVHNEVDFDGLGGTLKRIRHLAFTRRVYDVSQRFKHCYKVKSLRTLLALPIHQSPWTACCYLSGIVLSEMLKTLRCLRSLCLSGYYIIELPNSIGDLKHLRYLNLSYTKIKCLPESVSNLVNLETLGLRGCSELTTLPSGISCLIHLYCLDIRDTNCLLEMPPGIGNLTSIRVLTKYIVGKGDRLSLRELKDLCLRGELSIYGLGNVGDIVDARVANLKEKSDLDELATEWSENINNSQNKQIDMSVLDFLRPHWGLKKLRISHYGGTKFPSWIGDPSFTDMVCLNLCNCRNIVSLPPLGLLPALRELCIECMDGIERVDAEFYGESAKPFPSLEILQFKNMLKWVHWSNDGVTEHFPHLHQLTLHNCPKLKVKLPSHIPSVVKLTVTQCPNLMPPITLTCLRELNIIECNEGMLGSISGLSSLKSLKIRDFSECTRLPERFLWSQGSPKLQTVSNCTESNSLGRQSVEPVDVSFSTAEGSSQSMSLVNPDSLCIGNLKNMPPQLHHFTSLKYLLIESFPNLVSFPDTASVSMLKHLILKDCRALRVLPKNIMIYSSKSKSCLEELEIEKCQSLKSFPEGKLPISLKRLTIQLCENLQSIPEGIMHDDNSSYMSQLEILKITSCPSLNCSTSGKLPYGLKKLELSGCSRLEPLTETMIGNIENSKLLECIEISHCDTVSRLPEVLHGLFHLTEIAIVNCPNLKSFPETGLPMSLQLLTICDCQSLLSFGCLPQNLTSLEIWNCMNLQHPISEWNLHGLTSLKEFSFSGGCFRDIHSFPDHDYMLPGSLISLCICSLKDLETLSRGLNNLTLLRELEIIHCHKLHSLPLEGLLSSLGRLRISDCSLLRKECFKWKGCIPCIELDGECI